MQISNTLSYMLWGVFWVVIVGLAVTTIVLVPDQGASLTEDPAEDAGGSSQTAEPVQLDITIDYADGEFTVINDEDQTWERVTLNVNPNRPSSDGYRYATETVDAGGTVNIPADTLTGPDGDAFDPDSQEPETVILEAERGDEWGIWMGRW